jgi:hypothetical protein
MRHSAYDIAVPVGQGDQYRFSMDPTKVIAALQEVIDGIKSGRLLPQRASFETEARRDDYVMSYVHMVFHEKQL